MSLDNFLRAIASLADLPPSIREMAERSGRRVDDEKRAAILAELRTFLASYTDLERKRAENMQQAADAMSRAIRMDAVRREQTARAADENVLVKIADQMH